MASSGVNRSSVAFISALISTGCTPAVSLPSSAAAVAFEGSIPSSFLARPVSICAIEIGSGMSPGLAGSAESADAESPLLLLAAFFVITKRMVQPRPKAREMPTANHSLASDQDQMALTFLGPW
jgi:hypothetical protein